jgi:hypothetical protein
MVTDEGLLRCAHAGATDLQRLSDGTLVVLGQGLPDSVTRLLQALSAFPSL